MCNCIDRYNEALEREGRNVVIDAPDRVNLTTGKMVEPIILIPTTWANPNKRKRGQRLPVLFSVFCPLCGERYEVVEAKAA